MYVNPFVMGVLATIFAEMLLSFIISFVARWKRDRTDG